MRDLAVFDLDGTLITGDSFRELVRASIAKDPRLALLALWRRLGLASRGAFAEGAHRLLARQFDSPSQREGIARRISERALPSRLDMVRAWRSKGAATLLLSASPDPYVAAIGVRLEFDFAFGSSWINGQYRHLYGAAKAAFLDAEFPASRWRRAFAIADSESDLPLLQKFAEYKLVEARG